MEEITVRTFYFDIQRLSNRIETSVLYKSRNQQDNVIGIGNNSTVDAELLIKEYIGTIAAEIFSKITSPMGRQVAETEIPGEPFEFDVPFNEGVISIDSAIVFRVVFPEIFDSTTSPAITRAIEDAMVSYCVWQWLMDSNLQRWEIYEQQHLIKMDNLRSLTTRRVNLKRTYKLY